MQMPQVQQRQQVGLLPLLPLVPVLILAVALLTAAAAAAAVTVDFDACLVEAAAVVAMLPPIKLAVIATAKSRGRPLLLDRKGLLLPLRLDPPQQQRLRRKHARLIWLSQCLSEEAMALSHLQQLQQLQGQCQGRLASTTRMLKHNHLKMSPVLLPKGKRVKPPVLRPAAAAT